jgi:hypothetical protein
MCKAKIKVERDQYEKKEGKKERKNGIIILY